MLLFFVDILPTDLWKSSRVCFWKIHLKGKVSRENNMGSVERSYKVTPLCNLLLFKVTSNGFVLFKIAVTSNSSGTATFIIGKRISSYSLHFSLEKSCIVTF